MGRYSQELIALSDENEVISIFKPWIMVPDNVKSPESSDISTGVNYYPTEYLNLNFEAYYKFLENMIDINEEKYTANAYDFINVNGIAYGFELTANYQSERTFIKGSYSLSWTYEMKNGSKFYPKHDIRNSLNLLLGYNLGKGWKISTIWSLHSGMPFTPIIGYYDRVQINDPYGDLFDPFQPTTYKGERNSKRLPYYHRLDLSISKYFMFYFAKVTIDADVLNLYNRKNIFYFNRDTGNEIYMLPFFPSISIKVEL
jgi:hypothetical protein